MVEYVGVVDREVDEMGKSFWDVGRRVVEKVVVVIEGDVDEEEVGS
ncbi:hypothetical protein [Bacillus sp. WP8]|nr:hypothetical protein [Bacillus sp. WP8]